MITDKVKNLFDFIDWLHSQIDVMESQKPLLNEIERMRKEYFALNPKVNFEHNFLREEIEPLGQKLFEQFKNNCKNEIYNKIEQFGIANGIANLDSGINQRLKGVGDFLILVHSGNYSREDTEIILKAKTNYVDLMEKIDLKDFLPFGVCQDFHEGLFDCFEPFITSEERLKIKPFDKPQQEQQPQQPQPITGSRTKQVILEKFENFDNNGWAYAFKSETDFNLFVDLLTNYFEANPYQLPTNVIQLKKGCKTKTAKTLGEIQKELSQQNLSSDKEFFKILRMLNHFEKEPEADLYKALTR